LNLFLFFFSRLRRGKPDFVEDLPLAARQTATLRLDEKEPKNQENLTTDWNNVITRYSLCFPNRKLSGLTFGLNIVIHRPRRFGICNIYRTKISNFKENLKLSLVEAGLRTGWHSPQNFRATARLFQRRLYWGQGFCVWGSLWLVACSDGFSECGGRCSPIWGVKRGAGGGMAVFYGAFFLISYARGLNLQKGMKIICSICKSDTLQLIYHCIFIHCRITLV